MMAYSYDGGAWDRGQFRTDTAGEHHARLAEDDGVSQVTVMATYPGDANLDGVGER